jgi:hypothetical protein
MTAALAVLNPAALVTLADCEQRIERGLKSFIDVGEALATIHNGYLYRATHATFEEYCRERWNLSRPRAYELMVAADVVSGMPDTEVEVSNARQASALAKVPEAERADVWAKAVERTEGKPTAAAIREVHEERTRSPFPGPSDAAIEPPVDPGATPPAAPVPPDPQEPDLTADVVRVLAGAGKLGLTVAEVSLVEDVWPDGVVHADVLSTLEQLCEAGRVVMARLPGGDRWMLTPEPITAPPVTPPPGSPATWTDEQRAANQREIDRKRMIADGRTAARDLVMSVRAEIGTVVKAIDLGETDLINPQMIADLRRAIDLLESRLEASK